MTARQDLTSKETPSSVKSAFTGLADAMIFLQRKKEAEGRVRISTEAGKRSISELDNLVPKLAYLVIGLGNSIGKENAKELSAQIANFSSAAVQQMKAKVSGEFAKELEERRATVEAEAANALRSLETFLLSSPFHVIDKVISLKLLEGVYGSNCRYRCEEGVEYSFSLDSEHSEYFKKEFSLSKYGAELKLPIGLGKAMLKREPAPDFVRLDGYILQNAESNAGNVTLNFAEFGTDARVRVVYWKKETEHSLSIEYSDKTRKVEINKEPTLNKHLNVEELSHAIERLWLGINELEGHKLALTSLVSDGKNIMDDLDSPGFFHKSWEVIAPRVVEAARRTLSSDKNGLTEAFVREKIKLLGETGEPLRRILRLTG